MGVTKASWSLLKRMGLLVLGLSNDAKLRYLRGKRIAIDSSVILHHFVAQDKANHMKNYHTKVVNHILSLHNKLKRLGVTCCWVFDGMTPPMKVAEDKRRHGGSKSTGEDRHQADINVHNLFLKIELLNIFRDHGVWKPP